MKRSFEEFKNFIKDKKVAVVGIGVSNIPLIYFLVELGAKVTAFDKKTKADLGDDGDKFQNKGVQLCLGEGYLDMLTGFDVVFKTPSMRIDSPALVKVKNEGAYITSEMEEFVRYCPGKIFGITGSDGKTTSTTLVYKILSEEGHKTWVGGNIGTPLFSKIQEIKKEDKVVLELSSFQLMTMDSQIDVALVTNVTPNHLDMHNGMDEYVDSKKNVFKFQEETDLIVLNRDNLLTSLMKKEAKGKVLEFSTKEEIKEGAYYKEGKLYLFGDEVCSKSDLKIMGMHNVENFLGVFSATCYDASIKTMKKVATTFTGVEHRCELVCEINGVKYYNDSIASSPTRTLAGLNSFDKPVILIAGGYDKKIPFEPLAEEGFDKIKALVLIGVTKKKIKSAFDKVIKEKNLSLPIVIAESLEDAVDKAKNLAEYGDIVTLSPACASFDMFTNFEVRGNRFKEIVKALDVNN